MEPPKNCWNCGEAAIEPCETWYKCRNCGATTSDIPKVAAGGDLQVVSNPAFKKDHHSPRTIGSLTKAAAERAAKARESKSKGG